MAASQGLRNVFWSLNEGGTPLSAFQRVLLMTDGTVTDILEAYLAEAILVVKLAQSFTHDNAGWPDMELLGDERVLHRSVLLQGSISGTNFILGESVIIPDRLPAAVLKGLLTTSEPIGRLLADNRVETFREIVSVRFEAAGGASDHFGVDAEAPIVLRTYRIDVGGRPVMCITESFPVSWFGASTRSRDLAPRRDMRTADVPRYG